MSASSSPSVACQIGNSTLHQLNELSPTSRGEAQEITWRVVLAAEAVSDTYGYSGTKNWGRWPSSGSALGHGG